MTEFFMEQALLEAKKALAIGEVPIGAVVVLNGKIIGRGFNQKESLNDPTAHAEILAIKAAANFLGSWRLTEADLYVTLEPCPMCAGAIVNSRIGRLFYGADDPKTGAVSSLMNLVQDQRLNHWVEITGGICQKSCSQLLKEFFLVLRKRDRYNQER